MDTDTLVRRPCEDTETHREKAVQRQRQRLRDASRAKEYQGFPEATRSWGKKWNNAGTSDTAWPYQYLKFVLTAFRMERKHCCCLKVAPETLGKNYSHINSMQIFTAVLKQQCNIVF